MEPDLDRMTADLAAMVRIPSVNPYDDPARPGFREREVADWLLAAMDAIGLETAETEVSPGRPNVWGRLRGAGNGPVLMLAGHMDTVGVEDYADDPFRAEMRNGRLYGRGAVDMKGALAAMLETARMAKGAALAGDLLLMFVADEEHLMTGSIAAGRSGPRADACVVCEPSMLAVAPAHKGQSAFPIEIEGRAVHSSRPELGDNALTAAARLIREIEAYDAALSERPAHALLGHGRATPVLLTGGESHSAVPGRATLTVDRRTLPGEGRAALVAELETLIARAGVKATVGAPAPEVAGLDTPLDAPIARATLAAARTVGAATEPVAFPGGTDAPNFGCPAVVCGPGDLAQAHTANEYIELSQLDAAARLYLETARRMLGEVGG